MAILATLANMRRVDGTGAIAYSSTTGEMASATPGDYFYLDEHSPLLDANRDPMILVVKKTIMYDPMTGEEI